MSEDKKLQEALDFIAEQSEALAETTQAFTDLTRMTLGLALAVKEAKPRPELLEFMNEVFRSYMSHEENKIALCREALTWLDLFREDVT